MERRKLIDVDEFGVEHKWLNRSKGWGVSCYRVRMISNYKKETKLTVILAIKPGNPRLPDESEGSIMRPRRWIKIWRVAGTDAETFADFVMGCVVLLWDMCTCREHMTIMSFFGIICGHA